MASFKGVMNSTVNLGCAAIVAICTFGGTPSNAATYGCNAAGGFCGYELEDLSLVMTSEPLFFVAPGTSWSDGYQVTARLTNYGSSDFIARYHGGTSDYMQGNVGILWGGGNAPGLFELSPGADVEFVISTVSGLKNVGSPVSYELAPAEAGDQFIIPRMSMMFSLGKDQDPTQVVPQYYVTMGGYQAVFDESLLPSVPLPASLPLMAAGMGALLVMRKRRQNA
ncbi:VPLPA-CTERM sorting domain-containing protein [Frigidibacter sp. MR17.24]|uniref:VPLPA-CTERM sorting domain-containing protein n=1 Tax=Frigidibacter sp. MR17.24 TaxID=3127345 RepID=UPI003012F09B